MLKKTCTDEEMQAFVDDVLGSSARMLRDRLVNKSFWTEIEHILGEAGKLDQAKQRLKMQTVPAPQKLEVSVPVREPAIVSNSLFDDLGPMETKRYRIYMMIGYIVIILELVISDEPLKEFLTVVKSMGVTIEWKKKEMSMRDAFRILNDVNGDRADEMMKRFAAADKAYHK